MEIKKSKQADLENKKGLFFQIGMVITLSFLLIAFEWKSVPTETTIVDQLSDFPVDEEFTPITRQIDLPPPPPPPKIIEKLNIVDNNLKTEETEIPNLETNDNNSVDFNANSKNEEAPENDVPFFLVEDMPKFNGGDQEEFRKYIQQNLSYPEVARKKKISGTVYVQFAVNTNGEVCDIVVLSGVDPLLDKEAVRVIKSSPRWTPGKERGHPVKVQFNFPILFVIN
jgi:periplasmic protein TonB